MTGGGEAGDGQPAAPGAFEGLGKRRESEKGERNKKNAVRRRKNK